VKDFDRHIAIKRWMVGFEYGCHAPFTELFHDAIRTDLFAGIKGHGPSNVEQATLSLLTSGQNTIIKIISFSGGEREPDVLDVRQQSRVSTWTEYLRKKMERGEVTREDEEMEV
jgi:hypothetical protein